MPLEKLWEYWYELIYNFKGSQQLTCWKQTTGGLGWKQVRGNWNNSDDKCYVVLEQDDYSGGGESGQVVCIFWKQNDHYFLQTWYAEWKCVKYDTSILTEKLECWGCHSVRWEDYGLKNSEGEDQWCSLGNTV